MDSTASVKALRCRVSSPYGPLELALSSDGTRLQGVELLGGELFGDELFAVRDAAPVQHGPDLPQAAQDLVRQLVQGGDLGRYPALLAWCDWGQVTPFRREVLTTLFHHVRPGQTITYGQLAQRVGRPRAVRAVGSALRNNPFPVLIPCHRVVAQNGLGGFMGNPPGAAERKRAMLAIEGLIFDGA